MKILAVDMSNITRMAWESALSQGKPPESAFQRVLATVTQLREGFDRVAICCDGEGKSFRTRIDAGYKAKRNDPGQSYRDQLARSIERMAADGCHVLKAPKCEEHDGTWYEADDVTAGVVAHCREQGWSCRIVSADSDLASLIDDEAGIDVQRPDQPGYPIMGSESILAKYGLSPARIIDMKALAGDNDGYKPFPGFVDDTGKRGPGIAQKTAVGLLKDWGTALLVFEEGMAAKDENDNPQIKGHTRALLEAGGMAALMRGLDCASLRIPPLDYAALNEERMQTPISEAKTPEFSTEPEAPEFEGELMAPPGAKEQTKQAAQPASNGNGHKPVDGAQALAVTQATAVSGQRRPDPMAYQPRNLTDLWQFAVTLHDSRIFPQFPNPGSIFAAAALANEQGIPVVSSLMSTYVVNGRLSFSAGNIAGRVMASGKAKVFRIEETTPEYATVKYQKLDDPEPRYFKFTIDEANKAGWTKKSGPWQSQPRTMLRWAALRECARAFWPDVVFGLYMPDEIRGGHVTDEEFDVGEREEAQRS